MSTLFKMKKASLGMVLAATVIMTSLWPYSMVYAAAPGAGKEYVEPEEEPKQEEVVPQTPVVEEEKQEEVVPQTPVVEGAKREEVIPQTPVVEEAKQEETVPQVPTVEESKQNTVKDEVYSVNAPRRIYNQDWSINPNDWTYTDTEWTDGTASVEGHYGSEEEVKRMYELINEYRIANGKEPLAYNTRMETVNMGANERAVTTANYWEHWSYRWSENIAYTPVFYSGYDDMEMVEKVFEAWINSAGHRSNILNAGSTKHETAIAVFYKKVEGGYERYWVQCFR